MSSQTPNFSELGPERYFQEPYNIAIVELQEGPRLMTSVIDIDPEAIIIGMPVTSIIQKQTMPDGKETSRLVFKSASR